ncbi:hypothetical protein [Thalassoglobus polymorphus]|uniref:hypothetical protein n=1 Tax=Thalassoglobus polymorphus TaxID=2527994 RepID=UPI0011AAAB1D|nr:hypothetical protein [Thalassoglobus polymorphus]
MSGTTPIRYRRNNHHFADKQIDSLTSKNITYPAKPANSEEGAAEGRENCPKRKDPLKARAVNSTV